MSTILASETYNRISVGRLLSSMFLNPLSFVRLLTTSFVVFSSEVTQGARKRFASLFERSGRNPLFFSLARIFFDVLAGELITLGTILDLKRGVPFIWANYIAYDELGHHWGPQASGSYRVLRGIDRNMKRILKNMPADYDVYILSDHGMTASVPFTEKYGYSLSRFVDAILQSPVATHESLKADVSSSLLLATIWKLAQFPFVVFRPLGWFFGRLYERWVIVSESEKRIPKRSDVIVEDSSGLAHVYFMLYRRQLFSHEIQRLYPGFIQALAKHPGVGILCVRAKQGVEIYVRGTKIDDATKTLLDNFGEHKKLHIQIERLLRMKYCGDIVLFGDFNGRNAIALSEHWGIHSGAGGPQNEAFIMAKKELVPQTPVLDALELHAFFRRYAGK